MKKILFIIGSMRKQSFNRQLSEIVKEKLNIIDFLVNNSICSSKREAREFIQNGSISINGEKETSLDKTITKEDGIEKKYFVVRRGKKKYYLVIFE